MPCRLAPTSGVGARAKPNDRRPISWAPGTGTSGPAGSSRNGFPFRLISPNERSTVSASSLPVDDLVFRHLVEQDAQPSDAHEAARRERRQRNLAVAPLELQAPVDDCELALGGGALTRAAAAGCASEPDGPAIDSRSRGECGRTAHRLGAPGASSRPCGPTSDCDVAVAPTSTIRPGIRPMISIVPRSGPRSTSVRLDAVRHVDRPVVGGRSVVVAVAVVAAVDDPADARECRPAADEAERAIAGDVDRDEAVRHSEPSDTRTGSATGAAGAGTGVDLRADRDSKGRCRQTGRRRGVDRWPGRSAATNRPGLRRQPTAPRRGAPRCRAPADRPGRRRAPSVVAPARRPRAR